MFQIRSMRRRDFDSVTNLIYLSTNSWYQRHRGHDIFQGGPEVCRLFCEVYEDLDAGCAMVAEHEKDHSIIGSCFVHPRETHISIGILNVHPSYFGAGVAAAMMDSVIAFGERKDLPLRLISSAMNLDSFSLYNRKGFVPTDLYQDLLFEPPKKKEILAPEETTAVEVREAALPDIFAMGKLEFEISGISREQDYCYFIENARGCWHTVVAASSSERGEIDGFLVSIDDPGSRLIGPGIARSPAIAAAMVYHQLQRFRGKRVVCLAPADQPLLVKALYQMGGRNCELHISQVRGEAPQIEGIVMPSFMPETG